MTPVTLEAYAQLVARLACRRGATVAEVLAEIGVAADDLTRDEPALRAQLREAWARRKGVAAMKFAAAIGDELEKLTPLGGGARPLETLSAPVVQVPLALLDPAAGDGPSRWAAQAPSYVTADPRAAAPALVPPAPSPPPVAEPPLHRPPTWLASTAPVGAHAPTTAAMPFAVAAGAPASPAAAPGPAGAPGSAVDSGTVALGDEVAAPPVPAGIVDLTTQQYASLRAELQLRPAHTAAILERYRVAGGGGRAALDAYWRSRFEADPLLRMVFARAYAEYLAWLKANPVA